MSEPPVVAAELVVVDRVVPALRALQLADQATEAALTARLLAAQQDFASAVGDPAQREAFEEALAEAQQARASHQRARRSRELPLGTPYFARLILEEATATQEVLLGKVGVMEGGLRIVDWRNAPISRLYYDYDEGDEYEETLAGRVREGLIAARRRVDVQGGNLVEVEAGGVIHRRRRDGGWGEREERRADTDDHRLPDIVSLITRDQFSVISGAEAGVVLLRGRAGSGKTTVALHRVAWLHFQDPQRFRPEKMLVVMFNKALQTYIARVLPELGVAGVRVETFHAWAGRMLRQGGISLPFQANAPASVVRLKRHPAISGLLERRVAALKANSDRWLAERGGGGEARQRMRERWLDHVRDLRGLFDDDALCREVLPRELHGALDAARAHSKAAEERGCLDWQDAALLLRVGQLKQLVDPSVPCPWAGVYAHLVVDEAQDLSTVEIEALVYAADSGRCVTLAGDPAQKILADAQFEGFEALLARLGRQTAVRLDALQIGHRSTRPIMELALRALGRQEEAALAASRDGEPVVWFGGGEAMAQAIAAIAAFRAQRPTSLVAVLCKRKSDADAWAAACRERLSDVRRAARDDFAFEPGVVVSNVHQVKGLEFDGVVLVEPADFGQHDRHLLHVAITRAADRLWVVASRGEGGLGGGGV